MEEKGKWGEAEFHFESVVCPQELRIETPAFGGDVSAGLPELQHPTLESDKIVLAIPGAPIERFINTLVDHSKSTKKTYRAYLNMLEGILKEPLGVASLDNMCAGLNWFKDHYSSSAYAVCKAALRGFLRYIKRPDLIESIPNKGVRWIPRRGPRAEEIDLILEVANFRERALILALYSTGLRIAELLGNQENGIPPARVEDIDWERGVIYVTGKGGNRECAPFFIRRNRAMSTLKLWLNGREHGPIFELSPAHAWRLLSDLGKRIGVKVTPHLLRHSTARSIRRGGGDVYKVKAQLRHKKIESTLAYEYDEPCDLIEAARAREWR